MRAKRNGMNWLVYLIITLLVLVAIFMVVSLVLASYHNVSIVGEWQRWIDAMKPAKETVKETAKTTAQILFK